jgi:hypothetical protein
LYSNGRSIIQLLGATPQYNYDDEVKIDVISGAFDTRERDEKCLRNYSMKSEEKTPFGKPKATWGMILKWIRRNGVLGCGLVISVAGFSEHCK